MPLCYALPIMCDIVFDILQYRNNRLVEDKHNISYFNYGPSGASVKQLAHYAQTYYFDRFCEFCDNFSAKEARKGMLDQQVRDIPLEDIQVPTAIFIGKYDEFTTLENARELRD